MNDFMKYSVDTKTGEYICSKCDRRFPVSYWRISKYGRAITRRMVGAAKANFIRHLESCIYYKARGE